MKIYILAAIFSIMFTGCHDYTNADLDQRVPFGQHLDHNFKSVGSSDRDDLERYQWLKEDTLFSKINVDVTNDGKIVTVSQIKDFSNSSDAREFFDYARNQLSNKNGSMTCRTEFVTPDQPVFTNTTCSLYDKANRKIELSEMLTQTGYLSAYANRYLPLFLLRPVSTLFSDSSSYVSIQYKND